MKTFFDLHLDWVVMQVDIKNAFNSIFQTIIFKELQDAESPLANIVRLLGCLWCSFFYLLPAWAA
jgi:hypothetical protein